MTIIGDRWGDETRHFEQNQLSIFEATGDQSSTAGTEINSNRFESC